MILYGEEATKKAQKEGEEAAAAYEQEKRDIAAGILPTPPSKPEKKVKRKPGKKRKLDADATEEQDPVRASEETPKQKRRVKKKEEDMPKPKAAKASADKESLVPILARSAGKAVVLGPRPMFAGLDDSTLMSMVSKRLLAVRALNYTVTDVSLPAPIRDNFRPCAPYSWR